MGEHRHVCTWGRVAGVMLCSMAFGMTEATVAFASPERGDGVHEVADGVWAVLQPQALRFNDANSLFVVGTTGVTVVDTQATLAGTQRTIAAIEATTSLPVRELVITHWHGDHVQGVDAYRGRWPGVAIIAHRSVATDLRQRTTPALLEDRERYRTGLADARERLTRGVDREGLPLNDEQRKALGSAIERGQRHLEGLEAIVLPLRGPTLAYGDSMVIDRDGREIELMHVQAHTRGDTLVWIDDGRVLASGDVLDDLPFGGHGYPTPWLAALERIEALAPAVIVPGHGRLREGLGHAQQVRRMLQGILTQVEAAVAADLDLEATQAAMDLASFEEAIVAGDGLAQRHWNVFIPALVERAWQERRGTLSDDG